MYADPMDDPKTQQRSRTLGTELVSTQTAHAATDDRALPDRFEGALDLGLVEFRVCGCYPVKAGAPSAAVTFVVTLTREVAVSVTAAVTLVRFRRPCGRRADAVATFV